MPQPQFPPTTATKTFTVTNTKLMVATAALAFASGLAMMFSPSMDYKAFVTDKENEGYEQNGWEAPGEGEYNGEEIPEGNGGAPAPAPAPAPANDNSPGEEVPACKTTTAEAPPIPDVKLGPDATELLVKVFPSPKAFSDSNTLDHSCWTRYAIYEMYLQKYVGEQGELEDSPAFLTDAEWGLKKVVKLKPGTEYVFKIIAKNYNDILVESAGSASSFTSIYPPLKPTISDITSSTVNITLNVSDENPADVQYSIIFMTFTGVHEIMAGYVQNDGIINAKQPYRATIADWGKEKITVKNLPNYFYHVYVRSFYAEGLDGGTSPMATFRPTNN